MHSTGAATSDPERPQQLSSDRPGLLGVMCVALAALVIHLIFNRGYGYFRDELYYLACGQHLAWGYVDQPPLVALVAWISRGLFGESLSAVRVFPALSAPAMVIITGLITRELGGRAFAMLLSAICVLIAPVYLAQQNFLNMNAWDPLIWMACVYFVVLAVNRRDPKWWLWFGVAAGVGLENKYAILVFGFGIFVGLLLTPTRRVFLNKWIWMGAALAFLIFLPNLIWNVQHHFPFVELMRNIRASGRDVQLSPFAYFSQQILLIQPISFPIWMAGLGYLFFARAMKPYRLLGWAYLTALIVFIVLHGKDYYLAPIYPMLFASGAVAVERGISRTRQNWAKSTIIAVLLIGGALSAPMVLPILPIPTFLRYQQGSPIKPKPSEKAFVSTPLPQIFADELGWPEMTERVAKIYHSLPADLQPQTAIFGGNYGQAAAIDFFGPRYGLPKAISGHQNYWIWGPHGYTGESIVILGRTRKQLEGKCADLHEFPGSSDPLLEFYERRPIFYCRGLKFNLQQDWEKVKDWD